MISVWLELRQLLHVVVVLDTTKQILFIEQMWMKKGKLTTFICGEQAIEVIGNYTQQTLIKSNANNYMKNHATTQIGKPIHH